MASLEARNEESLKWDEICVIHLKEYRQPKTQLYRPVFDLLQEKENFENEKNICHTANLRLFVY